MNFQIRRDSVELKPPLIGDLVLLVTVGLLVAMSLLMLYSTTGVLATEKFGDPLYFIKRQIVSVVIGWILLFSASRISIETIKKISPLCLPLSYLLLLLPLIPGIGDRAGGAQRWVGFGPFRFQPGEFVKVLFIIYICGYYTRHETRLKGFLQGIVIPLGVAASIGVLLLLQPDFGSTVVIFSVTLLVGSVSGVRIKHLSWGAFGAIVAGGILIFSSAYRMRRVMNFLNPWEDIGGKGYQLYQSLVAVGSGKFFGLGLGESQQKLFFLPAAHTDFIFAVVAEELGLIGCFMLIALFVVVLWRGLRIALRASHDTFAFSLAMGMTLLVVLPATLNMGVVTGLLPTKGMVLPLFGYGGSSIMASLGAIGVLLAVTRRMKTVV